MDFNVFFGGTFDPPHMGHDQILQALTQSMSVSKVFLVPTFVNPLKIYDKATGDEPLGNVEFRKKWIAVWLADFKKRYPEEFEKITLKLDEIDSSGSSYTIETLKKFQDEYKNSKWVLSVGEDQLLGFELWNRVETLFEMLKSVWIFPRSNKSSINDIVNKIPKSLRDKTTFRIMTHEICDVSSTGIRRNLREKNLKALDNKILAPVLANI